MNSIVCPLVPFPNIFWWSHYYSATEVYLEMCENFEKMSFRNKYMLASPSGVQSFIIPLHGGRQQRTPMKDVRIDATEKWQTLHWRGICSLYNRSPYFEFFKPELARLFEKDFSFLVDFNLQSIELVSSFLQLRKNTLLTTRYQKDYPAGVMDIRTDFKTSRRDEHQLPVNRYKQVFEERCGFLPNLSILDLLFAEARNSLLYLS